MKVLLPEGTELKGFERKLQETLERANLEGYALMGFSFREVFNSEPYAIDALLILKPGTFVCLEAKGYRGKWTGTINSRWFCNGSEIGSSRGPNPYEQVQRYALVIKNRLQNDILEGLRENSIWVNCFVVAPDEATFEINGVFIDEFVPGKKIKLCHLSKIEQVLGCIRANELVAAKIREIGVKRVIEDLAEIATPQPSKLDDQIVEGEGDIPPLPVPQDVKKKRKLLKPIAIALTCLAIVGSAVFLFPRNHKPCESSEVNVQGTCYKDLSKAPLVIGILGSPEQYSQLRAYLKQQLGSQISDVVLEGNPKITYQEAQAKIARKKWDVVFAYSPMNSLRAKDNGYRWVARMFPDNPPTYQSALFVRADSKIQSIEDIKSPTTVALGDHSSASTFYMPAYDLYGKSMNVTRDHRSSDIKELVASGKADVGAAVYSSIKADSRFRVIHVSREIPGSGVYISPQVSPTIYTQVQSALLNAPAELKKVANYGLGEEPNYEVFRAISVRAEEATACADFTKVPVQFFCNKQQNGIAGKISGFTNQDNGVVKLRFVEPNNKVCNIVTSLRTLSRVPNGGSPGNINGKAVNVIGIEPRELPDGSCELAIADANQLVVQSH